MVELKNFPNYFIDEYGNITSFKYKTPRRLAYCMTNSGYKQYKLYINGKVHYKYAHRLVYETYISDIKNLDINHIDGNKLNNYYKNLEKCSRSYNVQHAFDNNLSNKGEYHYNSQLSNHKVKVIKELLLPVLSQTEIAKLYNVKRRVINKIATGKTWRHI